MSIAYENLRVVSNINYIELKRIQLRNALNEHASLSLSFVLDPNDQSTERLTSTDEIRLVDKSTDTLLFCGIIGTREIVYDNNYKYLHMTVVSGSCLLDYEKHTRTFQGITFEEILSELFSAYQTKAYVNVSDDTPMFEVQYNETDYEFIKRLAARRSLVVMPHIKDSKAKLYIDVKSKDRHLVIETNDFSRYDFSETATDYETSYYKFSSLEHLDVGDLVTFGGYTLVVIKAEGNLKDGLILFEYEASLKYYIRSKAYEHPYFAGTGLEATVLAVDNRNIKVKFDVDKIQDINKATWIPYGPIGCAGWYTMPAVGTKVMIMFENESASSAVGISMKRIGHDDIESMSCPQNKAFTTKEGSYLSMIPDQIALANDYTSITLGDRIEVVSNDRLTLSADNEMNIGRTVTEYIDDSGALTVNIKETKRIAIRATELLSMVVLSKGTGLEMDEEVVINSLGKTNYVASDRLAYEPIVVMNDISALDETFSEETAIDHETNTETKDSGFWETIGKVAGIAAATVAIAAVAVVIAPVVTSAIVGAGAMTLAASFAMGCVACSRNASFADGVEDGAVNTDVADQFETDIRSKISSGPPKGVENIGQRVSGLSVVNRVGIETDDELEIDIVNQLMSDGFKLSEVKWGQAALYGGLSIYVGEATSLTAYQLMNAGKIVKHVSDITRSTLNNMDEMIIDGADENGEGTGNIDETYVTKTQLQSIYTNTTVTDEMITDLNRVLGKYGITDIENIQHFIAQTCIETGYGDSNLEKGSDSYLNGKKYGKMYSGVGYIQMTWDYSYAAFATYMILEKNPDLNDVARYRNPKSNNRESIFNEYEKLVNEASSRGYDISEFTDIVDIGRDYVVDNFAWETAGYYWSTNGLTSANSSTPVDDITTVVNKWTDSYKARRDAYDLVIKYIK